MKQLFLIKENHPRLLLFFAGWGMDEHLFKTYQPPESDLLICYDYRTLIFDETMLEGYRNITLVGWSMGVWAASQLFTERKQAFSERIALNGTPYPIDQQKGIPPILFQATQEGLNEQTLRKFYRRMCLSSSSYSKFQTQAPQRPIEELKEELACIKRMYHSLPPAHFVWNKAFIGTQDRIFPTENQLRAWGPETTLIVHPEAHYSEELIKEIMS